MDKGVRQQDLERPRRNPQEAEARDGVRLHAAGVVAAGEAQAETKM